MTKDDIIYEIIQIAKHYQTYGSLKSIDGQATSLTESIIKQFNLVHCKECNKLTENNAIQFCSIECYKKYNAKN